MRLTWGTVGQRFYEAGVDHGVLFVGSAPGVPWNGLISVNENPSGGSEKAYYLDGVKYLAVSSAEEYSGTITALSSPAEFDVCDGLASHNGLFITHQRRTPFSFAYRSLVGNDVGGIGHAYLLHIIYNALASPPQLIRRTLGGNATPVNFSWAISTKAPTIAGHRGTSHLIVDSRSTNPDILAEVEDLLYGTESEDSTLPTPAELIAIFDA
jgi:hypothetical protein